MILLALSCAIALGLHSEPSAAWESHYAITGRAPFNQPEFYPISQTLPENLYRPTANWMGRLILPTVQQQGDTDWVWMEVYQAPARAKDLIGKQVRVEWSQKPSVQQYVATVTRDVQFTPHVEEKQRTTGNLYPIRLNGRSRVGPLQAIAGARPKDDVIVALSGNLGITQTADGTTTLQLETEPAMATGRYYALVKILGSVKNSPTQFIPKACPGTRPCPSELFRVQHYNLATKRFDGIEEIIRIPQQPVDGFGVYASTPRELEKSPAGTAGWYVYGAQDKTGLFTVQAIKPRSLFQLQPQQIILDQGKGLDWINYNNWKDTEKHKGTIQTVLIDPTSAQPEAAIANWKEGDRVLVMHLFGGRGGKNGEKAAMGTVTGHFSYGIAEIVREPFTNELQVDVRYEQVYATNIEGIIAGTNTWTNYMGNLQRGWMGTRPVADVLIKLDAIAQAYDFDGNMLSPLDEFIRQLQIINARYRTGDGTGAADVTAATSCVQDSNQALFLTIQRIRETVESSPAIQQWWSFHPNDPTIQRFEKLVALGNDLEQQLTPLGIVRSDWKLNADALSGTGTEPPQFSRVGDGTANVLTALTSWRTILPRQAQDELSILFLRRGAALWVLRTNQVGGSDPDIVPLAPTPAFGRWTFPGTDIRIVSILVARVLGALKLPNLWDWSVALGGLLAYAAIALPIGFSQGFLQVQVWKASKWQYLLLAVQLFLMPSLLEELIFRVVMLPYPGAGVTEQQWILWAIASLVIFVICHPLNAKTLYKNADPTFFNPIFLTLTLLLGIACIGVYYFTGSLLTITVIHWGVVVLWLMVLGGLERLHPEMTKPSTTTASHSTSSNDSAP